jgi:hypothetical protein
MMWQTLFLYLALSASVFAQTATLSGRVTDESGAVVPGAVVRLEHAGSRAQNTTTKNQGTYSFGDLVPGTYTVTASAPHLESGAPLAVAVKRGANLADLRLKISNITQKVTVQDSATPGVSVETANNASATIITGTDLDSLSDDPQDLADDLAALAGPSAGPSGGAIFVDGFSGGQLPPKDSIREIRINSNPFSPEYDKLGIGRIEIFTKPGSDKFHGSIGYNIGTAWWNTRNPYASQKAPFLLQESENSFSGPLSKRSSFTLDFERQAVNNGSITNAVTLDGPFSSVLTTPQRHWLVGPHFDYQINDHNTLSVRYLGTRADIRDAGIGSFDLTSRGYHLVHLFQTVQAIETVVHGASVNETRFQYFRHSIQQDANTIAPEIQVLGAFNGGGALMSHGLDTQNNLELQNYTTILHGVHSWRFGVRLRGQSIDSLDPSNFNGTFTFAGELAPELNAVNQAILDNNGQPILTQISSIEVYRRTLLFQQLGYRPTEIRALGGGASQFTMNAGNPSLSVHQFDGGFFAGDDWHARPNLTLNFGLRYELQTNIHDARDIAPRVAVAWSPGSKSSKTVIRGGFGMFYDRFALTNVLTAQRYNGLVQQQYVVTDPDFYPNVAAVSALSGNLKTQAIEEMDSHLRAPVILQSAITLEHQLPKKTTLAVTYTNARALHVLRSADINAPQPVTGDYPYPGQGPIFLMTSAGIYNQNQMIVNINSKVSSALSIFGYYVLNHAMSNSDGLQTFPANPYSGTGEYGPASTDVRNRVVLGGNILTRWNVRFNPFVTLQTGAPFNITTGNDPFGTTVFTARPGLVTNESLPGLQQTAYGLLDPNPTANESIIPRNYGRGPGIYAVNLRVGRTWGFGGEKGAGTTRSGRDAPAGNVGPMLTAPQGTRGLFGSPNTARRYNLTVSMSIRNLLNHTNQGPIIGNITSPLFGRSNQIAGSVNGEGFSELANNRRLELQMRFTF